MEIVLVRHGRPALDRWPSIGAREMAGWIAHYDAAGIVAAAPPAATRRAAAGVRLVVSSTARRAVDSAQALASGREHLQSPLFGEAALPHPTWALPKLPPALWAAVLRACWLAGFHPGVESVHQARRRARLAAARLTTLAQASSGVLLCGHGIMNRLIAHELVALGWRGPRRPASGHWGTTRYVR